MPDTFAIHPDNPRCFRFQGKPFKILTSAEHYGAVLNGDFDLDAYLREMRRTRQNMTRLFTFYRETPASIKAPGAMNTLAPSPAASVLPWERVAGQGKAADGLDKFDLERWNPAYFARLKEFVTKCDAAGIVCEIVLFCQPYDQQRLDLFPCGAVSNVNGVGADLADWRDFMTLKAPSIVAFQEAFARKLAAELNACDNVYYEICNEPRTVDGSAEAEQAVLDWHAHLARVLREAEAGLPQRHLIAANAHCQLQRPAAPGEPADRHEDQGYFANPDIDIVNYHYISAHAQATGLHFHRLRSENAEAGLLWHFLRERDGFPKPIVFDETFSGIVGGAPERYAINRAEAWETLLSGGAGYDNLDWSFTPADATGAGRTPIADGRRLDGRCLREWLGVFHGLLAQYDLAALVPAVGVLPDAVPGCGYAASREGEARYLLYFVDERLYRFEPCEARPLAVPLRLPAGRYSARTFDPRTGETAALPALQSDGTARLEVPAFTEDVAVVMEATGAAALVEE
jgi:Cellulase (glycosyl hydrolase family 5)/Family of unknown function (DUF6298)